MECGKCYLEVKSAESTRDDFIEKLPIEESLKVLGVFLKQC